MSLGAAEGFQRPVHSGAKRKGGSYPPCAVKDGEMANAGEG